MAHRDLDVLDAAERAADGMNRLIDRSPRQLLHVAQMRDSAQSISANIREAFGKSGPRDRARSLEIARAETEETIGHLGANFRTHRIPAADYWPLRNLLVVIAKMLTALIHRSAREPRSAFPLCFPKSESSVTEYSSPMKQLSHSKTAPFRGYQRIPDNSIR